MNTKILTMLVFIFTCFASNIFAGPKVNQQVSQDARLQELLLQSKIRGIENRLRREQQALQNKLVKPLRAIIESQLRDAEVQFALQNPENCMLSDAQGNSLLYPYNAIHDDPIVIARADEILGDISNNEIDGIEAKSLDEFLYKVAMLDMGHDLLKMSYNLQKFFYRSPISIYINCYNKHQFQNNLVKPFRAIVEAELRAEGIEFNKYTDSSSSCMSLIEQYKNYPANAPADDPLVVKRGSRIMWNVTCVRKEKVNNLDELLHILCKFEPAAIAAYVENNGVIDAFSCARDLEIECLFDE